MFYRVSLMLVLFAGLCTAQDAVVGNADMSGGIAEFDGKVVTVDAANNKLTVKDQRDKTLTLKVSSSTVISNSTNSKLAIEDIQPNDRVHVYYTTGNMTARQIDLTTAAPILRQLGAPKAP